MKKIMDYAKTLNGIGLITYVFFLTLLLKYSDQISNVFQITMTAFASLFIGIGIAFVLNIPMTSIENRLKSRLKKNSRAVSIVLTYILALVVIVILLSLIVPQLVETVTNIAAKSDVFEQTYMDAADFIKSSFGIDIPVDFASIITILSGQMEQVTEALVVSLSSVANGSVRFFIAMVVSIYLLAGKEKMIVQLKKMLVSVSGVDLGNKTLVFLGKVNKIFHNYISGLLLDALIIGSMVVIMMLILNLPYAILVGVITSVLAIIPIFGNIMAMFIGAILIFAVSPIQCLYFLIGYQVVQQLENNLIYPRIVGSSVGLPGLWTLLSISVAGSLFGFVGMLVAVPVTSTLYMVLSEFSNGRMTTQSIKIDGNGKFLQKDHQDKISS